MPLMCICRVALEFLREIRLKAQTDLDASRDQGACVFGLGVVFVDEAAALSTTSLNPENNIEEISSIVLSESEKRLPLHIAKLQDLFVDEDSLSSPGEPAVFTCRLRLWNGCLALNRYTCRCKSNLKDGCSSCDFDFE